MTSFFRRRERVAPLQLRVEMPTDVAPADIARQLHFAMGGRWPTPESETTVTQTPTVGRIVHYVSYGTPGGEYKSECRAAVVTATPDPDGAVVDLCVLNPEGFFFNRGVEYHDGAETPGDPDCPNEQQHGSPFRYCSCGWIEASPKGGTWHWPERA